MTRPPLSVSSSTRATIQGPSGVRRHAADKDVARATGSGSASSSTLAAAYPSGAGDRQAILDGREMKGLILAVLTLNCRAPETSRGSSSQRHSIGLTAGVDEHGGAALRTPSPADAGAMKGGSARGLSKRLPPAVVLTPERD